MADIGRHLLGRKPSPPDLRDFRLANFQGIGEEGAVYDVNTEIALAVKELQATTITYKRWAATTYKDVQATHWWQAFNHLANASGNTPPFPTADKTWEAVFTLDQGNTGHCHPAGTLVRMADETLIPIEDVRPLSKVLTAEGGDATVQAVMGRTYIGDLLTIKLRGHDGVQCTPEHPLLTRRGYVKANDLRVGDSVAVTRRSPHTQSSDMAAGYIRNEIWFHDFVEECEYRRRGPTTRVSHVGGVRTKITAPPRTITLNAKFGRLLGLYAAEGYCGPHDVKWAYGKHEAETLVPETVELLRETLGAEARVQVRPNGVHIVVLGGKHWSLLFKRIAGTGAGDKSLRVLNGGKEFREAVLFGWIDGDGHRRRNQIQGTTVSRRLAFEMHSIANDLGLRPTIRSQATANRRVRWDVVWGDGSSPQSELAVDATWRKITQITSEEFFGNVYNLEVEERHSFVANGIGSHNCVGFGWAGWGNTLPVDDNWADADGHAIYYECKVIEGDPGGENGAYTRDGAKAMLNRSRLSVYAFADTMADILAHLRGKGPVVVGTDWTNDMFDPDSSGYVKPTGGVAGGHCYLLYGVQADTLIFKNSWGAGWGLAGSFRMRIPDFQTLLDAYGEAVASVELPL